jgi:hypothetical protein
MALGPEGNLAAIGRPHRAKSVPHRTSTATPRQSVEFGHCALGHLNGCLLPFVVPSTGGRYLRIVVTPDKTRESRDRFIALIAHELQHALEVLVHPEVVDVDSMLAMYAKIGVPLAGRSGYETSAAHAVQDAVLSERVAKRP